MAGDSAATSHIHVWTYMNIKSVNLTELFSLNTPNFSLYFSMHSFMATNVEDRGHHILYAAKQSILRDQYKEVIIIRSKTNLIIKI